MTAPTILKLQKLRDIHPEKHLFSFFDDNRRVFNYSGDDSLNFYGLLKMIL